MSFQNQNNLLSYHEELSLADPISVDDDPVGLEAPGRLVEHHQMLLDHRRQFLNDFNPMSLDSNCGRVTRRMSILAADNCGNGRLLVVAGWRVGHIRSEEDDRLAEDLWPDAWNKD